MHGQRAQGGVSNKPVYSKVFRWNAPPDWPSPPQSVELIGTMTDWRRVPLLLDSKTHTWQATVQNIPGNKTHHYMLLVDGKPTQDKNCDGLAMPVGAMEEQYAITTPRGPRVFMLFAQTK
jgi:hypothetical protein